MTTPRIPRVYGLLVILAQKSNPNGDPDSSGAPRIDSFGNGIISPVSVKRRLRDLVGGKSVAWESVSAGAAPDQFDIYVSEERTYSGVAQESKDINAFHKRYWDARLFGNTILEQCAGKGSVRTGIATFSTGTSLAPVVLASQTWTRVQGMRDDAAQGMAPQCHQYVEHGLYIMPFTVNPERANLTNATAQDVEIMLKLLPRIYDGRSVASAGVEVAQVWTLEFDEKASSIPLFRFIQAVSPTLKSGITAPTSIADYDLVSEAPDLAKYGKLTQML